MMKARAYGSRYALRAGPVQDSGDDRGRPVLDSASLCTAIDGRCWDYGGTLGHR
jgi:hypothetical protein